MTMNREKKILEVARLFNELSEKQQKSVIKFIELLKLIEGLPTELQQEIFDNIQDNDILEIIEIYKSTLS